MLSTATFNNISVISWRVSFFAEFFMLSIDGKQDGTWHKQFWEVG